MEFLKQWTFCFCLSLIAAVILSMFSPNGNMKNFYKLLISAFVFISFIYPFKDIKETGKISFDVPSSFIQQAESDKAYELTVNNQIKKALEEKGIIGCDVSSSVTLSDDRTQAVINAALISVPDEYDKDEVKRLVFDELGIEAEVKSIGE